MIVGLTGHYGSGKDATGAVLVEDFGFERVAFADEVRREVATQPWPHLPWRIRSRFAFDRLRGLDGGDLAREIWTKPTSRRMRMLLQWWGTEYRRAQDPDYWLKRVGERLAAGGDFVVTDVRFPNEVELIRRHGGEVWMVQRDGCAGDSHVSERGIAEILCDRFVANNDTLPELQARVRRLMKEDYAFADDSPA